ncbi:hypothetical protein T484DRAFT_1913647 [Baffinella frigidus]|nr:hypothetical protein T484DRAFT_1913647 [Cryptophyta sp. CCMP2293]
MCITDECVEMVKEMTAELFREQRELVARLNTLHERIEAERQPVSKVLRKVEWMEEKERSVEQLNKAVASLQGALEADAAIEEMAAAAINKRALASTPSPPRAFSKIFRDKQTTEAAPVNRMKAELFTMCMESLDQGSIRIAKPAQQAMHEPPTAQQQRSRRAAWRDDDTKRQALSTQHQTPPSATNQHQGGAPNRTLSTPTSRRLEDQSFFSASPSKIVRENFTKRMHRMLISVRAWRREAAPAMGLTWACLSHAVGACFACRGRAFRIARQLLQTI